METIEECGFKKLTIADKVLFDVYYAKMNDNWVSTLSFASMIAWNSSIHIYHRMIGEYLCCLAYDTNSGKWYMIPFIGHYECRQLESSMKELLVLLDYLKLPVHLVSVSEWMLPFYLGLKCIRLKESYDDCLSDYIYKAEDFWSSVNNQSNRYDYYYFIKQFNPRLVSMDNDASVCYTDLVSKAFCCCHECVSCVYGCQLDTIRNISGAMLQTGAKGIAVYIEDALAGYAVVTLEKSQMIYHFKENLRGYRGIGTYLNRKCFELYGENMKLINYTEDMGLDGLRKYKQKLADYSLSHKYELC